MKNIQWPTAIVLIVLLIILAVAYLAGPSLGVPAESHAQVVAAVAAVSSVLLAFMRKLFGTDENANGKPDFLEGGK